jgi:hypothetical protein
LLLSGLRKRFHNTQVFGNFYGLLFTGKALLFYLVYHLRSPCSEFLLTRPMAQTQIPQFVRG